MYNPLTPIIAEQHRDRLLDAAQERRTLLAAMATRPSIKERFCVRLGALLIATGLKLQEAYNPPLPPCSETYNHGR